LETGNWKCLRKAKQGETWKMKNRSSGIIPNCEFQISSRFERDYFQESLGGCQMAEEKEEIKGCSKAEKVCIIAGETNDTEEKWITVIWVEQQEQEQKGGQRLLCSWWCSWTVWTANSVLCVSLSQASVQGINTSPTMTSAKNVAIICLNNFTGANIRESFPFWWICYVNAAVVISLAALHTVLIKCFRFKDFIDRKCTVLDNLGITFTRES